MNEITVFSFESNPIRMQIDESGQPWWLAKDVCELLEIKNVSSAVSRLDAEELRVIEIPDPTGRQNQYLSINESGLYSLILRSKKPAARQFKKWVTSEVLPSIRKTGSYNFTGIDDSKVKAISGAEQVFASLSKVARAFNLENNQALLFANKATKRVTGVDFQNILQIELKTETQLRYFTPTELGSRLSISAQAFNKRLESAGLQTYQDKKWNATERGREFSVLLDANKKHSDGTPIQQLKWTEKALDFAQAVSA